MAHERLGVLEEKRGGVLIVGANSVGRTIGKSLSRLSVPVLLLDTNRWNVERAQNDGLDARAGNALDELVMANLDLDVIGRMIAVTSNDSVNRVAVQIYQREFGRENVHAIRLSESPEPDKDRETGAYLFGKRLSWEDCFQKLGADHSTRVRARVLHAEGWGAGRRSDDGECGQLAHRVGLACDLTLT